jgi:single-stranded-DNA-specific exonuclease
MSHPQIHHPLIIQTLARRGITDADAIRAFLDPSYYTPSAPLELPDMAQAVERIGAAIDRGERILVWGDFDVDGQTATALLVQALRGVGGKVDYYIPSRLLEGHGIDVPRLGSLLDEAISIVITCDTGIAAHDAVDYANGRNVDVVITDHHQLPEKLPAAHAVVNPQRLPEAHPARTLPGVGCAYLVMYTLYDQLGRVDEMIMYLDLVALGIVADVAEQVKDTRYYLQLGLRQLRQTQRSGLQEVMRLAEVIPEKADEEAIGFSIGPRLNALGRLADANDAVELLTTDDLERARILAGELERLNAERKMLTEQVYQAAQGQLDDNPQLLNEAVLVLSHSEWPGGIVGIVANRLVEQYKRPVILLRNSGGQASGSARSVAGCNITAAIAAHSDLLDGYGGHTMAAGLRLPVENVAEFRRKLSQTVTRTLQEVDLMPDAHVDAVVSLDELTLNLLDVISQMAPFGPGNPPLTLATEKLTLQNIRQLGRSGDHYRLTVADEQENTRQVVWWRADLERIPKGRFDLKHNLNYNYYKGERKLQITLVDILPVDEEPRSFTERADVEIIDHRSVAPEEKRRLLATYADGMIWAEGQVEIENARRRDQLKPAETLVVWSVPPGSDDFRIVMEGVNPSRIVFFAEDTTTDSVQLFLRRFGGVIKHVINAKSGCVSLDELCGVVGHRRATIRAGLNWLVARGNITFAENEKTIEIQTIGVGRKAEQQETTVRLTNLLRETAAYRAYFRKADIQSLIQTEKI